MTCNAISNTKSCVAAAFYSVDILLRISEWMKNEEMIRMLGASL
jgi:hypothetical protein